MKRICNNNTHDDDARLRDLFESQLPAAVNDPQFTRKVMNRLPRRRNRLRWVSTAVYAIAAMVGCGMWFYFGREAIDGPALLSVESCLICVATAIATAYTGVTLTTSSYN